ncbi:looped-hinge helix DNA binding domain, AbrB family [Dehalogenimonas alkenigignens]|uniref:Looped-hinge helix DNA binding domain, AbrB family n=1 Tax=Dehalogenimonas alkenigignens TaxID=1217799 RepID=A0A0W0GH05_9CHLR|nr:AbrB/MazE/SpoVT family DNA-binding domain-containing protein [Dehalogenimonas alkenigignens]KTB47817.1 looped-hinge helix DNA binding domain, AbrB family [Dehalogenimonas alkenigignens]
MAKTNFDDVWKPKFYGSTTIGERGQMVIPAEARKDFTLIPSSKLLVFGSPGGLMIVKAEHITGFLTRAAEMLRAMDLGHLQPSTQSDTTSED